MRSTTVATLILVAMTACKGPADGHPDPMQEPPAMQTAPVEQPSSKAVEKVVAKQPVDSEKEPTVPGVVIKSVGDRKVVGPSVVWTGHSAHVVWIEVEMEGDETWSSDTDVDTNGIDLGDVQSFTVRMAAVDTATSTLATPVELEGAGSGPKALSGPIFADPVWWDGTVAMAWTLYNEQAASPPPARMVVGRWKPDGTPLSEPLVVAKDRHWHLGMYGWIDLYLVAGSSLWLAWGSNRPASATGCHDDCGDMDSIAISEVSSADPHDIVYECGDVMGSIDVHGFGDGLLMRTDNEHVGYHTWLSCIDARCGGQWYESQNPIKQMLVTGGGAAVWYDELIAYEVVGHCVDIWDPDKGQIARCARPRTKRIEWRDEGLAVVVESKKDEHYVLPYHPGDRIHLDLLRPALHTKIPVQEAVWTGSSIVATWSKAKHVKVKVIERDGIVSQDG